MTHQVFHPLVDVHVCYSDVWQDLEDGTRVLAEVWRRDASGHMVRLWMNEETAGHVPFELWRPGEGPMPGEVVA